jgi:hypothetical protein
MHQQMQQKQDDAKALAVQLKSLEVIPSYDNLFVYFIALYDVFVVFIFYQ